MAPPNDASTPSKDQPDASNEDNGTSTQKESSGGFSLGPAPTEEGQVGSESAFTGFDAQEVEGELGYTPNPDDFSQREINLRKDREQSDIGVLAKETVKFLPNSGIRFAENVGHLADMDAWDDHLNEFAGWTQSLAGVSKEDQYQPFEGEGAEDIGNELTRTMQEWREGLNSGALKTHQADMSIYDPADWIKSASSVGQSVLAFGGLGSTLGAAGRGLAGLAKVLGAGQKAVKGVQTASQVASGFALANAEGATEAAQQSEGLYRKFYDANIEKGLSPEEARRQATAAAAKRMSRMTAINTAAVGALNFTGLTSLFRSPKMLKRFSKMGLTRKASDETAEQMKKRISDLGYSVPTTTKLLESAKEPGQEAVEEITALFANREAAAGEDTSPTQAAKRWLEGAFSSEGAYAATMGAMGGKLQEATVRGLPIHQRPEAIQKAIEEGEIQADSEEGYGRAIADWVAQKAGMEDHLPSEDLVSAKTLRAEQERYMFEKKKNMMTDRLGQIIQGRKKINQGIEENDMTKFFEGRRHVMEGAILGSIDMGVEEKMKGVVEDWRNMDNQEAQEKHGFETDPESSYSYEDTIDQYKSLVDELKTRKEEINQEIDQRPDDAGANLGNRAWRLWGRARLKDVTQDGLREEERRVLDKASEEVSETEESLEFGVQSREGVEETINQIIDAREKGYTQALEQLRESTEDGEPIPADLNEIKEQIGFEKLADSLIEEINNPESNTTSNADLFGEDFLETHIREGLEEDLGHLTRETRYRNIEDMISESQEQRQKDEGATERVPAPVGKLDPRSQQEFLGLRVAREVEKRRQDRVYSDYNAFKNEDARTEMMAKMTQEYIRQEQKRAEDIGETVADSETAQEAQEKAQDVGPNESQATKEKAQSEAQKTQQDERKKQSEDRKRISVLRDEMEAAYQPVSEDVEDVETFIDMVADGKHPTRDDTEVLEEKANELRTLEEKQEKYGSDNSEDTDAQSFSDLMGEDNPNTQDTSEDTETEEETDAKTFSEVLNQGSEEAPVSEEGKPVSEIKSEFNDLSLDPLRARQNLSPQKKIDMAKELAEETLKTYPQAQQEGSTYGALQEEVDSFIRNQRQEKKAQERPERSLNEGLTTPPRVPNEDIGLTQSKTYYGSGMRTEEDKSFVTGRLVAYKSRETKGRRTVRSNEDHHDLNRLVETEVVEGGENGDSVSFRIEGDLQNLPSDSQMASNPDAVDDIDIAVFHENEDVGQIGYMRTPSSINENTVVTTEDLGEKQSGEDGPTEQDKMRYLIEGERNLDPLVQREIIRNRKNRKVVVKIMNSQRRRGVTDPVVDGDISAPSGSDRTWNGKNSGHVSRKYKELAEDEIDNTAEQPQKLETEGGDPVVDWRSVEKGLPALVEGDVDNASFGDLEIDAGSFYVMRDGEAVVRPETSVDVGMETSGEDAYLEGSVGILLPNANGEVFPLPLKVPRIGKLDNGDAVAEEVWDIISGEFNSEQDLSKYAFHHTGSDFIEKVREDKEAPVDKTFLFASEESGTVIIINESVGKFSNSTGPNGVVQSDNGFQPIEGNEQAVKEAIKAMWMNVDMDRINKDGGRRQTFQAAGEEFDTYNDFLASKLKTDVRERTQDVSGFDVQGDLHGIYTQQPSLELTVNPKESRSSNTPAPVNKEDVGETEAKTDEENETEFGHFDTSSTDRVGETESDPEPVSDADEEFSLDIGSEGTPMDFSMYGPEEVKTRFVDGIAIEQHYEEILLSLSGEEVSVEDLAVLQEMENYLTEEKDMSPMSVIAEVDPSDVNFNEDTSQEEEAEEEATAITEEGQMDRLRSQIEETDPSFNDLSEKMQQQMVSSWAEETPIPDRIDALRRAFDSEEVDHTPLFRALRDHHNVTNKEEGKSGITVKSVISELESRIGTENQEDSAPDTDEELTADEFFMDDTPDEVNGGGYDPDARNGDNLSIAPDVSEAIDPASASIIGTSIGEQHYEKIAGTLAEQEWIRLSCTS